MAHRGLSFSPPSSALQRSRARRLRWGKYTGSLRRRPGFVNALLDVTCQYPLCRYCLVARGNIVEHSHPVERDPRHPAEVPARALTACAGCNADERESLRSTCVKYGAHLRHKHVDDWPPAAREHQSVDLCRRVSARRAKSGDIDSASLRRICRILKFPAAA
jgi:hypothetical protein